MSNVKLAADLSDLVAGIETGRFYQIASNDLIETLLNRALQVVNTEGASSYDSRLCNFIEDIRNTHGDTISKMDIGIVTLCEELTYALSRFLNGLSIFKYDGHVFKKVTYNGIQVIIE